MSTPANLRFAASHEWVRQESDGTVTIGISDHAQQALGELVYVELPEVGRSLAKGESCAVVESTKAASDVYSPIDGEVVAVNETLADAPETVNEAAFEAGWLFKLKPTDAGQIDGLLSADEYSAGLDA
ncbi:MAG: glycine cleavage system protein GcvH [Burkholderiaceae bacterium]